MKFLFLLLISFNALGATCKKLNECIDLSTQLTGKKIIFDKKILPFTYELGRPVEMNKENADKILSEALSVFGLAKIPTQMKDTIKLIDAREIRYHSDFPTFSASKNSAPDIPETYDPVSLVYKSVKGSDVALIEEKIKPLLSRYGRAVAMRDGSLVVIDQAINVKKILPLIQKQDFPLTQEEKATISLEKKREHELELARLKSGELHEIGPHKHKD